MQDNDDREFGNDEDFQYDITSEPEEDVFQERSAFERSQKQSFLQTLYRTILSYDLTNKTDRKTFYKLANEAEKLKASFLTLAFKDEQSKALMSINDETNCFEVSPVGFLCTLLEEEPGLSEFMLNPLASLVAVAFGLKIKHSSLGKQTIVSSFSGGKEAQEEKEKGFQEPIEHEMDPLKLLSQFHQSQSSFQAKDSWINFAIRFCENYGIVQSFVRRNSTSRFLRLNVITFDFLRYHRFFTNSFVIDPITFDSSITIPKLFVNHGATSFVKDAESLLYSGLPPCSSNLIQQECTEFFDSFVSHHIDPYFGFVSKVYNHVSISSKFNTNVSLASVVDQQSISLCATDTLRSIQAKIATKMHSTSEFIVIYTSTPSFISNISSQKTILDVDVLLLEPGTTLIHELQIVDWQVFDLYDIVKALQTIVLKLLSSDSWVQCCAKEYEEFKHQIISLVPFSATQIEENWCVLQLFAWFLMIKQPSTDTAVFKNNFRVFATLLASSYPEDHRPALLNEWKEKLNELWDSLESQSHQCHQYINSKLCYYYHRENLADEEIWSDPIHQLQNKYVFFFSSKLDSYAFFDSLQANQFLPLIQFQDFIKVLNNIKLPDEWLKPSEEYTDDIKQSWQIRIFMNISGSNVLGSFQCASDYTEVLIYVTYDVINKLHKYRCHLDAKLENSQDDLLLEQFLKIVRFCDPQDVSVVKTYGVGLTLIHNLNLCLPLFYDFALNHSVVRHVINIDERRLIYKSSNHISMILQTHPGSSIRMKAMFQYKNIWSSALDEFDVFHVSKGSNVWSLRLEALDNHHLSHLQITLLKDLFLSTLMFIKEEQERFFFGYYKYVAWDIRAFVESNTFHYSAINREPAREIMVTNWARDVGCYSRAPLFIPLQPDTLSLFKTNHPEYNEGEDYILYPPPAHATQARQLYPNLKVVDNTYIVVRNSHPKSKFIGLRENKNLSNRFVYPWVPCCYPLANPKAQDYVAKMQNDSSFTLYNLKDLVKEDAPPRLNSNKILLPDQVAPLLLNDTNINHQIYKILVSTDDADAQGHSVLDGTYEYLKLGVHNVFRFNNNLKIISVLQAATHRYVTLQSLVQEVKRLISQNLLLSCGLSISEALDIFENSNYMHPQQWLPLLRKLFHTEIVLFGQDFETNKAGSLLCEQFDRVRFVDDAQSCFPRCVMVYMYKGSEFEYDDTKNPTTELIIKRHKCSQTIQKLFDTASLQVQSLRYMVNNIFPTRRINQSSINLHSWGNRNLDSYGKVRQLEGTFESVPFVLHVDPVDCIPQRTLSLSVLTSPSSSLSYCQASQILLDSEAVVDDQGFIRALYLTKHSGHSGHSGHMIILLEHSMTPTSIPLLPKCSSYTMQPTDVISISKLGVTSSFPWWHKCTGLLDSHQQLYGVLLPFTTPFYYVSLSHPIPLSQVSNIIPTSKFSFNKLHHKWLSTHHPCCLRQAKELLQDSSPVVENGMVVGLYKKQLNTDVGRFLEIAPISYDVVAMRSDVSASFNMTRHSQSSVFTSLYYHLNRAALYLLTHVKWKWSLDRSINPTLPSTNYVLANAEFDLVPQSQELYTPSNILQRELSLSNKAMFVEVSNQVMIRIKCHSIEQGHRLVNRLQYNLDLEYKFNQEDLIAFKDQLYVPQFYKSSHEFAKSNTYTLYNSLHEYKLLLTKLNKPYQVYTNLFVSIESFFVEVGVYPLTQIKLAVRATDVLHAIAIGLYYPKCHRIQLSSEDVRITLINQTVLVNIFQNYDLSVVLVERLLLQFDSFFNVVQKQSISIHSSNDDATVQVNVGRVINGKSSSEECYLSLVDTQYKC